MGEHQYFIIDIKSNTATHSTGKSIDTVYKKFNSCTFLGVI